MEIVKSNEIIIGTDIHSLTYTNTHTYTLNEIVKDTRSHRDSVPGNTTPELAPSSPHSHIAHTCTNSEYMCQSSLATNGFFLMYIIHDSNVVSSFETN